MAERGEFTRRAFVNGRIDLTQAEAVMSIVQARNESDLRTAVAQLSGSLSEQVRALADRLLGLRAYVEASIDFSDQDIEFFEYGGEYPTQFLSLKSRFMAPDQEGYECAMPIKFWRRQA